MGPRDKKWYEEHPQISTRHHPYDITYRVLETRDLRAMLPFAKDPERLVAIQAHLEARQVQTL